MSEQQVVIRTQGVTKTYGTNTVVKDVSMNIHKGDIYGFIGSNGAGKTTFIRCLMGLVNMTGGEIEILGAKGSSSGIQVARSKVGCIVESPAIIGSMNAYDCIKAHALLYYTNPKKEKLKELLQLVGLGETGNKKVKDFSLGMRQRMAIAQALVNEPEILILDEPTNGMDPQGIVEMRNFLHNLRDTKGLTILISSHILGELQQLANRFGIIKSGVLVDEILGSDIASGAGHTSKIKIGVSSDIQPRAVEIISNTLSSDNYKVEGNNIIIDNNVFYIANKALVLGEIMFEIVAKQEMTLESYFINKVEG